MALHPLDEVKRSWSKTRDIFEQKYQQLGLMGANAAIANEAPSIMVSMALAQNDLLLLIAEDLAAIRSYIEDKEE